MKSYWDTSALINAALSDHVMAKLSGGNAVTRSHSLAEFFGVMTGRGVLVETKRVCFAPQDAAQWLAETARTLAWVELTPAEVLAALADAPAKGVAGARVHDYLHAQAARKAGVDCVFTRDTHFNAVLTEGLPCARP